MNLRNIVDITPEEAVEFANLIDDSKTWRYICRDEKGIHLSSDLYSVLQHANPKENPLFSMTNSTLILKLNGEVYGPFPKRNKEEDFSSAYQYLKEKGFRILEKV